MSEPYTSQVHLKRLLAGQATAAFTPAPEAVLKMLDPAFFPGMGALNEDERGWLQCPVRGCGKYFRTLANHINQVHRGMGGVPAVKEALSIPRPTPLSSARIRSAQRAMRSRTRPAVDPARLVAATAVLRGKGGGRKGRPLTISARNFADMCHGQVKTRIDEMMSQCGVGVGSDEFRRRFSSGALYHLLKLYGSWDGAKAAFGYGKSKYSRTDLSQVLGSLREWAEKHGDLPSAADVEAADRAPYVPAYRTIIRAFGVNNWAAAMRSAIEHLGITSERYGRPVRRTA